MLAISVFDIISKIKSMFPPTKVYENNIKLKHLKLIQFNKNKIFKKIRGRWSAV